MSYEIAGRISSIVGWFGQWRSWSRAVDVSTRDEPSRGLDDLSAAIDDDLLTHSLATKHLQAAVSQLPERERQILLLHVNNGLTYWEIARRLGLTEPVVLYELSHAYSQLRIELSQDELRK